MKLGTLIIVLFSLCRSLELESSLVFGLDDARACSFLLDSQDCGLDPTIFPQVDWETGRGSCGLNVKCPHRLMGVHTWFPAAGAVLGSGREAEPAEGSPVGPTV